MKLSSSAQVNKLKRDPRTAGMSAKKRKRWYEKRGLVDPTVSSSDTSKANRQFGRGVSIRLEDEAHMKGATIDELADFKPDPEMLERLQSRKEQEDSSKVTRVAVVGGGGVLVGRQALQLMKLSQSIAGADVFPDRVTPAMSHHREMQEKAKINVRKGKKGGDCNVTQCQSPGASSYNPPMRAYYCASCAKNIRQASLRCGDEPFITWEHIKPDFTYDMDDPSTLEKERGIVIDSLSQLVDK